MAKASVTLNISVENLNTLLNQLLAAKSEVLDRLDELNANIDAITKAINSTQKRETLVLSETDPFHKSYIVSLLDGRYECTCPSYEFGQGLDVYDHCKHIRKVIKEGRFA